ncbi:MAG TPA: threonylcarbamoyl-AMP synthase, partial [Clostridiales bacterium]|nr:threonylcarbamoyl-AMP synthase [Clostridiales bacterium]
PTTAQHAAEDMLGRVPLIIDGGPCDVGVESTVLDMTASPPVLLRPGGVTAEMLENAIGGVALHPAVLRGLEDGEQARSPGMKYRHYAPSATVFVFEGSKKTVAKTINSRYDEYNKGFQKTVIFCDAKSAPLYAGKDVRVLGAGMREVSRSLFSELRLADDKKCRVLLFHYTDDMGLAVKNRILRAAGK